MSPVPPVPAHEQHLEAWRAVVKDFQVPGVTPATVRFATAYEAVRYGMWRFEDGRLLIGVKLVGVN